MPFMGSIIPSSLVGLAAASRAKERAKAERRERAQSPGADSAGRGSDVAELSQPDAVQRVEGPELVQENGSEAAREDRAASGSSAYTADGDAVTREGGAAGGSLDVRG